MRHRFAALIWPLVCVSACGGPPEPAANPEAAPVVDPLAAEGADSNGVDDAAAAQAPASPSSSAAPASDDDVNAILQLVIDDPELDTHLHLGQAGRFPLKLSGERLPANLKLVKATEPVKVVGPPASKQDAVLVVSEIDVQGDKATVRYRYDVEGIRGTVTLAKTSHGWELRNSRLVEH